MSEPQAELTVLEQPPKLKDLMEELHGVRKRWYRIGLQLNIPDETLDGIDAECKDNNDDGLLRMLKDWRRLEEASWVVLVKALRSRSVGEHVLAKNLEERFIGISDTDQSSLAVATVGQRAVVQHGHQLGSHTPSDGALSGAVVLRSDEVPNEEVQKEIQHLKQNFEHLRMDIYKYLETTKPNLKEFAVFVSGPMSSWRTRRPTQTMNVDLERVMQPGTEFYQMFCIITQYTNWYNYELMDNIAQRYGNPGLKEGMKLYCSEMKKFERKTSADKIKAIELARPLADSVSIIARLPHHHCNQFTGRDVRTVKNQYADNAGLNRAALRLQRVNESSVEIIFLVPVSLAPCLMVSSLTISPLLTSQDPLPEDVHERCVHFMHADEVFRLMGRTVTPPPPHKASSASSTQPQVQQSGPPVFRYIHHQRTSLRSLCSSVSLSSESSRPSEMEDAYPPIDPSRIQIYHDKVLMNGDSTVVCKAQFLSLPCAAKYVHQKLVETSTWQLENFKKGCRILQACRHPNIVTFLGIHTDNRLGRPILLMELMDQSLRELLERRKIDLPLYLQLDICRDVAQGLEYLHAKDIIHGNLTATNVLVKGGRAKICGAMSLQLLNSPDGELSLCPGAPESMPRRSFSFSDYDEAIDCFSFGVLGIHIATRELPQPHIHSRESTEVERYETSLKKVEKKSHPLYPLIIKCLNDEDHLRPSATKLCQELSALIRSSAYRTSQSAEHISTELVGQQIEYVQDKLREKTEEAEVLEEELKCTQTELHSANCREESLKNTVTMVNLQNEDHEKKMGAAIKELEEMKECKIEAVSEKDRMRKEFWAERAKTDTMNGKIKELQKERDNYKDRLEESDRNYARMVSEQ